MKAVALFCVVACAKPGVPLGGPCAVATECATGLACLAGKCLTIQCTTNDDCDAGFECSPTRQCDEKGAVTGPTHVVQQETTTVTVRANPFGRPIAGAIAIVNGTAVSTGADGTATLVVAAKPYDLTVLLPTQAFPEAGEVRLPLILQLPGLTRLDPAVWMYDASLVDHDIQSGTLQGASPDGLGVYWYDSPTAYAFGRQSFASNGPSQNYSTQIYRVGVEAPSGTFHALIRSNATPSGFVYGSTSLPLAATAASGSKSFTVSPPATHDYLFQVDLPTGAGWTLGQTVWFGSFGDRRQDVLFNTPGVNPFSFRAPVIPGFQKEVRFVAVNGTQQRAVNATITDDLAGQMIAFIDPPTLTSPSDSASVSAGTVFSWNAPSNATTVLSVRLSPGGPEFACITRGSTCALPDTSGRGPDWAIPHGQSGTWKVTATVPFTGAAPTVDDVTSPASQTGNDTLADTFLFLTARDADGATSELRAFTVP